MTQKKTTTEAGIQTMVRDEYLRFDGTNLDLRDYATDEVRTFQKPREGFVPVAEGIVDLVRKFEGRLHVPGVDPVTVEKRLGRYHELSEALVRVEKLAEMVRETRLAVCDEIMNDIYRVYRLTTALGRDDKEIHGAFDYIRDWLALGPRPERETANPTTPTVPPTR